MEIARRGRYFLIVFSAPFRAANSAPSMSIFINVMRSSGGTYPSIDRDSSSIVSTGASLSLYSSVCLFSGRYPPSGFPMSLNVTMPSLSETAYGAMISSPSQPSAFSLSPTARRDICTQSASWVFRWLRISVPGSLPRQNSSRKS